MKHRKLLIAVGGVVGSVAMAVLTGIYGDVAPIVRSFCEAALPSGTLVHEVDAGAAR